MNDKKVLKHENDETSEEDETGKDDETGEDDNDEIERIN